MGKLTNVQPAISNPSKSTKSIYGHFFLMAVVILKVLTYIDIFEIDYSGFILAILMPGTFLGLSFLIAIVYWIDQENLI